MGDKAEVLEAVLKEAVDLENIPIEEVFENLRCSPEGLTTQAAEERLAIFGHNKLEEKKESKLLKFLGFMWNPLSWVMEAAAIMAIALANGGGKPPDWQDFVGIITLLVINSTISFIEENNAGNAAAALMASLAPRAKVLRDGRWSEEDASVLVPGDIISIKLGDIVPADARLLEGDPLKIDQSALTGESLPVTKGPGDGIYSGSTCKQGEIEAVVIATGVHTFFGKAAHLVDSTNQVGHFQMVLTAIGNFCICSIAVGMFIEIIVMYPIQHRKYRPGIDNLLVLLIGGIPIAMPTVLSVTMAIGSHRLSQQGAITKRMTAIEEMAGMDVLWREGSIPEEKVFDGLVFPKTLLPPETLENPTTDDLVKIVQQEQELLTEIMKKNGAIILRGFGLSSADDFSRVVEATGWEEFTYRGAVVRKRPAPRVFTANEAPLEFNIGFHHEMALIKVYPKKLIIFCETPSPEGGQTAIIRSDVVVQRMEELMPDVVEKLEREGIRFFHVRQKDTWQRLVGVDDPVEAEKEAIEKLHYCNAFKYNEADGSAEIHYGPIFPIRELDGKRVMFNTIIGYVTEQMPLNATYGDGTPIPPEVLETYTNILAENCVDLNWEKGDIVIVNNLLCQHARRAGKPPRAVMVSVAN